MSSPIVAFDLETHLIQPGLLAPPVVCAAFWENDAGLLVKDDWADEVEALLERNPIILGANIAFDFGCFLAVRPEAFSLVWSAYEESRVYDVLIGATLDAIADGRVDDGELYRRDGSRITKGRYSLEECVRDYLGRGDAKSKDFWRKRYALLENTPIENWPPPAREYPIDDVRNTFEVYKALETARNQHEMPVQAWAAFCVHLGSVHGLKTNEVRVQALKASVAEKLKELQVFALSVGLARKEKGKVVKDKEATQTLVEKAYNGSPPRAEKGGVSTTRETLEDSGNPTLVRFSELGRWEKYGTYLPELEKASTVPMTTSCNILLATGRASYKGLAQVMPRKLGLRECFEARPGKVFVSVDYAAIEMSTLAQVCLWSVGDSDLADAINAGQDPHCILGADLIGESYEKFLKGVKAGDRRLKDIRQAGKAGNFGFPGMMGAAKFVIAQRRAEFSVCEWFFGEDGKCGVRKERTWKGRELDAPLCRRCLDQSEAIRAAYLKRWREIKPYWQWVANQVDYNGHIVQFQSKRIRGKPGKAAAANSYFQGLAADGAKRAVIALTKEMYLKPESPLYGSRLCVFPHDETLLETPEEKLHESAHLQAKIMVDEMKKLVPDVAVRAEPAASRFWSKDMEPVYKDGKLAIWEPK